MKKITLFTIAALSTLFSVAQDFEKFKISARVTPSIAWMEPRSKHITQEGNSLRFGFGISIDRMFTERYAFSTGLEVTRFGGNLSYLETGKKDSKEYVWRRTRNYDLGYVEVPLSIKVRTGEIGYMTYWFQFGGVAGVNIRAFADDEVDYIAIKGLSTTEQVEWQPTNEATFSTSDEPIKDDIQLFRLGLFAGAGVEYSLSGNTSLVLGVTLNNAVTNVLKGDHLQLDDADEFIRDERQNPKSTRLNARASTLGLNVGIKF